MHRIARRIARWLRGWLLPGFQAPPELLGTVHGPRPIRPTHPKRLSGAATVLEPAAFDDPADLVGSVVVRQKPR
jgi:hypothetical protein